MSASTVPVRAAIHQLVDALFDMLDTSSVVVMASNIARPEKPTTGPKVYPPPPPPPTGEPRRRALAAKKPPTILLHEEKTEHVRMSCYMDNGRLYVAINLSPEMCGRLGVAKRSAMIASPVDARGMIELRPSADTEHGYSLHRLGTSKRLTAMFPGERFGVFAKHGSTAVVYSHDLERNRLLITAPTWIPTPKAAAPERAKAPTPPAKATAPAPPPATSVTSLPSEPRVGRPVFMKCSECAEDSTMECARCEKVFCAPCWKAHTRAHLAGTVRREGA
jgi:hypothetical protein